jgi:putative FmdB family regulatory protein
MPIYEYACTACDHRVDILLGINDPGPHFCPSCGKAGTMRKLFAPPTIHYKGSGWAKKDRGGSGAGTKAAVSGKNENAGAASSEPPGSSPESSSPSSPSSSSSSSSSDGGSSTPTSTGPGAD